MYLSRLWECCFGIMLHQIIRRIVFECGIVSIVRKIFSGLKRKYFQLCLTKIYNRIMSIIRKYLSILIGYNTSKLYQSNVIFRKRKVINMVSQTTHSELKAFCEDTTIYGLRYFVNSRRPWERVFWISFLILGIFLSVLIVRKSLVDWEVGINFYDFHCFSQDFYEIYGFWILIICYHHFNF